MTSTSTSTNRNPETGVRYGMIALNSLTDLDTDLLDLPNPELEEALTGYCRDRLKALLRAGQLSTEELDLEPFSEPEEALAALSDVEAHDLLDSIEDLDVFWDGVESPYVGCEGTIDGVSVRVTELGGALMLWVFDSLHIGWYYPCSPCVPGAGDLDSPLPITMGDLSRKGGVLTYDVPPEWRQQETDQ